MTTTTTPSTPTPLSGASGPEWRDISRHSPGKAPLDSRGRERGALGLLLLATSAIYLWSLGASGYANEFYAAAVQAGTKSWKAFFFGSLDSANAITVDKPPAALWPMELSGRIFGFSSWSMLVPEALLGVLSVWLLYATVRRWFGPAAGLLAGAALALTPVAVLMFRFNNPDALMTLLVVAAAYCVTRALHDASTKWLVLAGVTMGFSFLAKGLQPFTVLPALAIAYLVAAPTSLRRRLVQLLAAGAAVLVAAGWWVLAVDLTPAADRPYIGGSGNNTALGLAFGYNGLSRITGGSGPGGANFSGATGIGRLFNSLNGGQISWLLPTALVAMVALAVLTRRAPRTDRTRAALIMWGGWLLVTGVVLSFASGTIHTYYSVELAPAIAALVGIGTVVLWRCRAQIGARIALAAGVLVTGWWGMTLLHRTSTWFEWLAPLVLGATFIATAALLVPPGRIRSVAGIGAVAALIAIGSGPAAYAFDTTATAHTGSTPSAGPAVSAAFGGGGGFGGPVGGSVPSGTLPTGTMPTGSMPSGTMPNGAMAGGAMPSGATPTRSGGQPGDSTVSSALVTLLRTAGTTWSAATVGSQLAAPLELQSGTAVIAIGGFTGSDNSPALAQFEALVAAGKIHYFIGGSGSGGGPFGARGAGATGSSSAKIAAWVQAHFSAKTIGGSTVYDLTAAK